MRRDNQIQIHRLFPEDTAPTLVIYSKLLKPDDKCILKYPKYEIWERMLIVPLANFDARIKSLRMMIESAEEMNPPKQETEVMGYDNIDDANSESYIDIESLSSEEILKMRDEL